MIYKTEVLKWWNERGQIVDDKLARDDKNDLLKKWNGSWTEQQIDKKTIKVSLNTPRWKYPIYLYFTDKGENYRIVGF